MGTRNLIRVSSLSVILWAVLIAAYPCGVTNTEASGGSGWQTLEPAKDIETTERIETEKDIESEQRVETEETIKTRKGTESEQRVETGERNEIWQDIETGHTIIRYHTTEDLKKFDNKIKYSSGPWSFTRIFSSQESNELPDKLKKKVDALYERAMEILDMRKRLKKVTINIYHDKKQLHAAYERIYKTKCPYRSWYTYENNTIYVNAADLTEGILAHEMAHSIIDHFLVIRPPKATAEILARYVDRHLFE